MAAQEEQQRPLRLQAPEARHRRVARLEGRFQLEEDRRPGHEGEIATHLRQPALDAAGAGVGLELHDALRFLTQSAPGRGDAPDAGHVDGHHRRHRQGGQPGDSPPAPPPHG
jgi:hypothetical protein